MLKLAQGEFVTVAKLEAVFGNSPLVRQIYVYGNSAHPYLLAVVVPDRRRVGRSDFADAQAAIAESLQNVAKEAELHSYEIPRDFLIETTPFTLENGLLTGIRKLARPKLKQHYGERLEQLYADLADGQANELRELRQQRRRRAGAANGSRAAAALLGTATADLPPDAHFTDLGGDSLSALTFANLLQEIFDVDVPVGVIVSPANDLRHRRLHRGRAAAARKRPTFASVHGRDATEVHAADLTLDKFIDAANAGRRADAAAARRRGAHRAADRRDRLPGPLPGPGLAGADGSGRRQGDRLVRAKTDEDARARLDTTFDSGDPKLLAHYRELAADHLEVIAGDKGEANLGLDQQTWQRLADTVDLIVDPAALVNHVLPYSQLFGPNALGTAELIRIALTTRSSRSPTCRRSAWATRSSRAKFVEDADIRVSQRRPARSTTATPTVTATASGPARCCCARHTTCVACRSRCSAAT